jgi:replicative DNA helicase
MQTKLTLRIESDIISEAKEMAQRQGKSISRVFSDYITGITSNEKRRSKKFKSPMSESLKGSLKGIDTNESDYVGYLEEKYK